MQHGLTNEEMMVWKCDPNFFAPKHWLFSEHSGESWQSEPTNQRPRKTASGYGHQPPAGSGLQRCGRYKGSIVCLTRVWQSLLPLFCDKTFEFAIQTWQTSLEHYYVYVQTYFLSQLRKMVILLISSYSEMCTLPTLRSRVFVCCEQYKHARSYCWQWTHVTMGPNEQNQHFAELRQKMCLYIQVVVLLTCLPSLDGKLERFVTKKWQKWLPNSSQTDYSHSLSQQGVWSLFGHPGWVLARI